MSPAAAPAIGATPTTSTLSIFGRKISWDAVLIAAASIAGIFLLYKLNKGGNVGVAFGQSPLTSDSTQPSASPWPLMGGSLDPSASPGFASSSVPVTVASSGSILPLAAGAGSTVPSVSTPGPPPGPAPQAPSPVTSPPPALGIPGLPFIPYFPASLPTPPPAVAPPPGPGPQAPAPPPPALGIPGLPFIPYFPTSLPPPPPAPAPTPVAAYIPPAPATVSAPSAGSIVANLGANAPGFRF